MSEPTMTLHAVTVDGVTRAPDRAAIRAYVAALMDRTKAVVASGGNQFQFLNDHSDQLERWAAALPPDERAAFVRMYEDELRALMAKLAEHADQEETRAMATASRRYAFTSSLAGVAMLLFVLAMLRAC